MTVIVIGMRYAATEIMVEIGTVTVIVTATEKVGAIDEARVENDTESLRQEEMIRLLCRQGEVVEGGKVDPMYHHHLRLPRHRQCMDRMREEDQDMVLDRELRKDHVEVAMAGVTMAERTQAAAALVEIETMTCH
jgi:hypothetical protein